jgi:GT2 family glycosyltransferase
MPPAPTVSALIVTHDSAQVLPRCLAALAPLGMDILVVDNGSADDTVAIAQASGAVCIANPKNEGFGRGMNIGITASDSTFVLLMNPDITLEQDALQHLLDAAQLYPDAAIFGPQIIEADGTTFFTHWSFLAPYLRNDMQVKCAPEGDCCVPFLLGACWLIRRDIIAGIGGFDDAIFLYYEDDDLCRRAIEAGHSLIYVPAAKVHHKRGTSSSPRAGRIYKSRFHLAWSKAYAARKWKIAHTIVGPTLIAAFKLVFACLTLNKSRMERYAGTIAGNVAFHLGRSATQIEGLDERAATKA